MERSYSFALIRFAPLDSRDERINLGVLVFDEVRLDIRVAKRLDKVKAISAAIDFELLREMLENLKHLDDYNLGAGMTVSQRIAELERVGPLSLSSPGTFLAGDSHAYEDRIASVLKALVEVEPAPIRMREKRSKLIAQVRSSFRQERVLAKRTETLDSHRIVSSFEVDEGLVADFVLRNGAMHVIETVDATGEDESVRRALGDIGIAALVLERARMRFGPNETKARLVYSASPSLEKVAQPSLEAAEHQGAELINWASTDQRLRFVHSLSSLATPTSRSRRKPKAFLSGENGGFGF